MAVGDRRRTGDEQLRVSAWRGDQDVAVISPLPDRPPPSVEAVRRIVASLTAQGVRRIVTSALGGGERRTFVAAGFTVHERLILLSHDLAEVPAARAPLTIRRARAGERPAVLALDERAFDPFWRLDDRGLQDAIAATPSSRFRVAVLPEIAGYAVWGRAGERGYLQRLATDPRHRRHGVATALVVDGLRWMRRHGVGRVVVNTQEGNDVALAAYVALGFRLEPEGLAVLALDVASASA